MRNFRGVLLFLLGLMTGLWLHEREKRLTLEAEKSRPQRSMEALSSTYSTFSQEWNAKERVLNTPEQHADRIRTILREVDLAALNKTELVTFKEKLEELVDLMWIDAQELIDPSTLPSSYEHEE